MSFHRSIISSGRTSTPAATVYFNSGSQPDRQDLIQKLDCPNISDKPSSPQNNDGIGTPLVLKPTLERQ